MCIISLTLNIHFYVQNITHLTINKQFEYKTTYNKTFKGQYTTKCYIRVNNSVLGGCVRIS